MGWAAGALVVTIALAAALAGIGVRSTFQASADVDEPQYLLTALSLAEDGDLDISDELAEQRWRAFSTVPPSVQTQVLADGRQRSPHDPLLALLLALPMSVGGWVAAKATLAGCGAASAALTLWLAVGRFAVPRSLAVPGVALGFASPPLAVYGSQVYPELPAALACLVAVAAVTGPARRREAAVLGAAVIALPWLGVKYVPLAAGFATIAVIRLARAGRLRLAGALVAGLAVAAGAYLVAHRVLYGGWTSYATGDHFARSGEFGVVGFHPDYAGRSLRLVGLLADREFGLVAWQPAWLLLVPAAAALTRQALTRADRPASPGVLLVPLALGWAVATWVALTMHGYWWPGRQLVAVLPLALLAMLAWLARAPVALRALAGVLGGAGALGLIALLLEGWRGRITWVSGFASVHNPLYVGLSALLPDYRSAGFWPLHLTWAALLILLVLAGWRSLARRSGAHPTHSPEGKS